MVSAWLITVANLPAQLIELLQPLLDSPRLLMLTIMVITMVVGTALDMTPTILLLTPVLMPVVKAAGIDPVYFGVLFIINNAIGLITPPVGTVLNAVAGVGNQHGRSHARRDAFYDRPVHHHVRHGGLPGTGHGARALVLLIFWALVV
jgi:TRAP-type C4-dicarboxylate transport system permease large subunit